MTSFQDAYVQGRAPWDTGRPQLEVVALATVGEIVGTVLDVGCGTGENSIYLAALGHRVLGIDFAPRAIEIARGKAAERDVDVEFAVCDAMRLSFPGRTFDTAVDSGVFHVFDDEGKAAYVRCLRDVVRPGGRVHVIVWSEHQPGEEGPGWVTQAELRRFFANGWEDLSIRAGIYETAIHEEGAKAWVASMKRATT